MYKAYCRIFARCGLTYLAVEAESGPIGGDASHEFMVPANNGEDRIVHCTDCGYGANLERAETGRKPVLVPATPGAAPAERVATPGASSIEQVCRVLKCPPEQLIKTLIYLADGEPVAVLVRGDHEGNEAKIRRALAAQTVGLADPPAIERATGGPVGFAGPVGLKCPLIADHDIAAMRTAATGANEAGAHLTGVVPGRDFEFSATFDLRMALDGDACPRCPGRLALVHGIEVGHVFKLGTKYSVALGAEFLDEKEERHPMIMGCYGIGINRIVASLAETKFDENGLIWPLSVAPYEVLIIPLNVTEPETMSLAERYYRELSEAGVDVLLDDRDARAGFKFKDADLIGIPLRIVIGGKGLKEGVVEIRWRDEAAAARVSVESAIETVARIMAQRRTEEASRVPA
jgi:prolyl-tRNA synthetase